MDAVPRRTPDAYLFAVVVALIGIGIVMIYSASAIVAMDQFGQSAFFLKRQLLWSFLSLGAMAVTLTIRYERLRRATPLLLLVVGAALVAVLVPGIGRMAGGARRWLTVGPLNFQPAEAAKLVLILYFANYLTNCGTAVRRLGVLWPPLLVTGAFFGLLLTQPDMGSAMMLAVIAAAMLFVGGARLWHLLGVGLAALPPLALATVWAPYRVQRLLTFLDPWRDPQGSGFHIIQSLLALGSGGLFGVGLGASQQKFFYLPERHTDFIFAILGEELGLVGTGVVIVLFALLAIRGFRIARGAPDRYSALLAGGITTSLVGQAMLNIGVTSGVLPVTGVPLPFISFGGSSLLFSCLGVGVLLNISQYVGRRAADPAPRLRPAGETS